MRGAVKMRVECRVQSVEKDSTQRPKPKEKSRYMLNQSATSPWNLEL
jgi:hypothetical protein